MPALLDARGVALPAAPDIRDVARQASAVTRICNISGTQPAPKVRRDERSFVEEAEEDPPPWDLDCTHLAERFILSLRSLSGPV